MRHKKFKHTEGFETKANLRARLNDSQRYAAANLREAIASTNRANTLQLDVQRLTNKVVSDAFMIQELKQQLSQQHIQLCNIRENYAGQQLAKLAPTKDSVFRDIADQRPEWVAGD